MSESFVKIPAGMEGALDPAAREMLEERARGQQAFIDALCAPERVYEDACHATDADAARPWDESAKAPDLTSMSDARLKAEIRRMTPPGAQVPEVKTEDAPGSALQTMVQSATMDAAGNVRMELRMSPDDRRAAHRAQQDMARQHASLLGSPVGLRGLFPSNKTRLVVRKRPAPPPAQETDDGSHE